MLKLKKVFTVFNFFLTFIISLLIAILFTLVLMDNQRKAKNKEAEVQLKNCLLKAESQTDVSACYLNFGKTFKTSN